MVNLLSWYDQRVVIRIPGDERVFKTQIMWVHDLPPKTVWHDNREYVSHISPELVNISVVFLWSSLPYYFNSTTPRSIALDAESGEWFCFRGNARNPITVEIDDTK